MQTIQQCAIAEREAHPLTSDAVLIVDHWHFCPGVDAWWCDLLDFATRLCTIQESKREVCAGYPFYGREPDPSGSWTQHPDCAYREEAACVTASCSG